MKELKQVLILTLSKPCSTYWLNFNFNLQAYVNSFLHPFKDVTIQLPWIWSLMGQTILYYL
jgi:hypothetical protein